MPLPPLPEMGEMRSTHAVCSMVGVHLRASCSGLCRTVSSAPSREFSSWRCLLLASLTSLFSAHHHGSCTTNKPSIWGSGGGRYCLPFSGPGHSSCHVFDFDFQFNSAYFFLVSDTPATVAVREVLWRRAVHAPPRVSPPRHGAQCSATAPYFIRIPAPAGAVGGRWTRSCRPNPRHAKRSNRPPQYHRLPRPLAQGSHSFPCRTSFFAHCLFWPWNRGCAMSPSSKSPAASPGSDVGGWGDLDGWLFHGRLLTFGWVATNQITGWLECGRPRLAEIQPAWVASVEWGPLPSGLPTQIPASTLRRLGNPPFDNQHIFFQSQSHRMHFMLPALKGLSLGIVPCPRQNHPPCHYPMPPHSGIAALGHPLCWPTLSLSPCRSAGNPPPKIENFGNSFAECFPQNLIYGSCF